VHLDAVGGGEAFVAADLVYVMAHKLVHPVLHRCVEQIVQLGDRPFPLGGRSRQSRGGSQHPSSSALDVDLVQADDAGQLGGGAGGKLGQRRLRCGSHPDRRKSPFVFPRKIRDC
jgi:hypothetical protein